MKKCPTCTSPMTKGGQATEVFHQGNLTITVTGIPAVQTCSRCTNAVLDVEIAKQVDELIQPLLAWPGRSRTLPAPIITITFPSQTNLPEPSPARLRKAG